VLAHAKQEMSQFDNLQNELLKFGGSELNVHILELLNNIVDENQIPKEQQTRELINK